MATLPSGPTKRSERPIPRGDVARKGGTRSLGSRENPQFPRDSAGRVSLRKSAGNMLAGGSRVSHHFRECDRRYLGLGIGLGFYSSRIDRLSSLLFKPPSAAPRLHSRICSASGLHPPGPPCDGAVPALSDCLRCHS